MNEGAHELLGERNALRAEVERLKKELDERKFWRPCKGQPDTRCNYLASCGAPCNKCGRVHNGATLVEKPNE